MKIEKNDPRLTAYVLNEITNEDRQLVEKALSNSAELRTEIEKLKIALGVLKKNTDADDDFFRLTNSQRDQIFTKIAESQPNLLQRFIKGPWGVATAGLITASFALMVFNHSLKDQVHKGMKLDASAELAESKPSASEEEQSFQDDMAKNDSRAPAPQAITPSAPQWSPKKSAYKMKEKSVKDLEAKADLATDKAMDRSQMAAADSLGSANESAGVAANSSASSRFTLESKSSALNAAASFGGSRGEGLAKGKLQKNQVAVAEKVVAPTVDFLLQTEPQVNQSIREKLHLSISNCLTQFEGSFVSVMMNWDGGQIKDLKPETGLTPNQKSCIEAQLKSIFGTNKHILLIKLNTVSK